MDNLPFRLLEEILFKLDPKSLAMVRCTNRSINSHISNDAYFQSEYLSRIGSTLRHISTISFKAILGNPFYHSRSFRIRNKDRLETTGSQIIGSCSGLLLLFVDGLICVANPFTERFRFLDYSNSKVLPKIIDSGFPWNPRFKLAWNQTNLIGFAVDKIDGTTQRFKIVCIIEYESSNPDEKKYGFEINTGDSCWKLSKTIITCRSSVLVEGRKPVYSDGSFHWLSYNGSILAFNPERDQAQLITTKFPAELSWTNWFAAAENELALITATYEVIYVYALQDYLTDPKWVLVKQIPNGVLDKKRLRYWNFVSYDEKCLILMETKKNPDRRMVHRYDLRANKWELMFSIPEWCYGNEDIYQFKPSFSSTIELNEKVDAVDMTKTVHNDDKRISCLSKIMRLVREIPSYADQNLFKEKETRLGKRLMIEDETKPMMMTEDPSSNKRTRVK